VLTSLPSGLSTQLGREFEGGVELSIGQWQKLALGRAMMRPAPLLLVLDEPTASLDAPTEHRLFERFHGAARDAAARSGAVTILISHRFSTVRMADVILVIADGRVAESGPHAALMAAGGLYAELYEMQARAYR
jgi:ATP-binding cassette subfamily B protein